LENEELMKFRTKLLILLLTITLLPLSLSFLTQRTTILHFGNKLASDTRSMLDTNAVTLLHALVDDYGRILKRDKAMASLTLKIQAQAVERRLFAVVPAAPQPIFFSDDYSSYLRQPRDLTATPKRQRPARDGTLVPIPVSFSEQVIFLAQGTKSQDVSDELKRMSSMPEVYRTLHEIQPDLFLWHYTALESGVHSSYPGKGGYPQEYDPRKRSWYQEAVQKGGPIQKILTDLTTGSLIMTMAEPIHTPAGKLAGVTALDIDYRQFFADWVTPADWADYAENLVLVYDDADPDPGHRVQILLNSQNHSDNRALDWRMPVERKYLDLNPPELETIQQDFRNGKSAVRKIDYQGKTALWAYGARNAKEPFPLVIVPYQQILAKAVEAEKDVNRQIARSITISAALTCIVVLAAVLLAIYRSRTVTRPISQLAAAAQRLAEGDFEARVDIHSGDEMEDLGDVFNGMGSRLKERELMKQSLILAKEIQQQLLPGAAPVCPNFDLAAYSLYCDETGGDYYDFIPLRNSKPGLLGLAVGDVSGHGIGAALVMATARGVLHTLTERHGSDLAPVCRELNYQLSRSTADAYFMTMFYAVLDSGERTLHWFSAGQAPIFLYRTSGQVEELFSTGIPLGILEDSQHEQVLPIVFAAGDILLIGTDGIWEAENRSGEMFGTSRVAEFLIRHAKLDAASMTGQLITELNSFRGEQTQKDDITLMIVKAV
jgi:sigma-B regulation protein RsbU (phosphoserine phosphatase)